MKIQNIGFLNTGQNILKPTNEQNFCAEIRTQKKNQNGTFEVIKPQEIELQIIKNEKYFQDFLARKGKVTRKEYEDIVKNHPSTLISAQKMIEEKAKTTYSTPAAIARAALRIKESFDEIYGNNGYRIISVGTSPAHITETMQALGTEVIFLPISEINLFNDSKKGIKHQFELKKYPNIKVALNYLNSKGVNEKNVIKDGKINLLVDYCCTGRSLNILYDLILSCNKIPEDKIKKIDISSILNIAKMSPHNKNTPYSLSTHDIYSILADMRFQKSESIANVPHFNIVDAQNQDRARYITSKGKRQKKVFQEFEEYSTPFARAFSLTAINNAVKMYSNSENCDI